MAWGVNDVDLGPLVSNGRVLAEDGDAPLPLQVVGVHDPLLRDLIVTEHLGLPKHAVHQSGLAMVDVSDDSHIPDVSSGLQLLLPSCQENAVSMRHTINPIHWVKKLPKPTNS